ncbi:MAG: translocation/assembly module TamB domain-containing protein, partial [Vicinamibacterales bacterium]
SATARFTGENALLTVLVPSLGAFVDSKIAMQAPYAYDAVAVVNRVNLAALSPLAGAPPETVAGNVSFSATASGTASDLAASRAFVNLQEIAATISEVPISLAAPSRFSWEQSTLAIDELNLQIGSGRLQASGALARSGPSRWDASFQGELGDLVRISHAFGTPLDLAASGQLTARWQSTGGIDSSTATVGLADGILAWGQAPPVTALTLQASFDGRTMQAPSLTGTWQDGGIQGSATMPRALIDSSAAGKPTDNGRAELRVTKLGAEAFAPWIGDETLRRVQGHLSAGVTAEISGPRLADVRATLVLDEAAYTVAGVEVQQAHPSRVVLDDGVVTLEDVAWTAGGSPLTVTGTATIVPAEARALDIAVKGDVNLLVLAAFAPTLATEGSATIDVRAMGALSDPRLLGRVDLQDAGLAIRDPRIVIGQVNGAIVLDGRSINFDGVTGTANGGDLSLDGRLTLEGASIAGGQLVAQLQRVALEFPDDLQSEASALLILTPEKEGWVLGGDVRIERSAYTEPVSIAALAAARRSRPPTAAENGPSWRDALRLNLFVVTEEDLRIDNNYGRIEAGAAIRVVGTAATPGLTGRVTLREGGQIHIAGNTFYVERGAISFTNPVRLEPEIDVEARAVVGGRDVILTLSGTVADLKTEVRSADPSVSDREAREALFGGLVGDEQALTLLSGELLGVTGRALGLDALRIERGFDTNELRADPTLIATETDPSARLTLAKRLGPEVELIVSQSLSESGALSAIVSYKPRRNVEIRVTSRDNIDRSISVRHEITFGGGGTTTTTSSPQPRITQISILGTPGRPAAEILSELRLDEGDRFDFHTWQRDVDDIRKRYIDQGRYEVRVRARRLESTDESTVALEYQIERGPRTRLVIEGHPLHDDLVRELEDAWTRIIFDQFLLEEIESRIRRHLFAEDYIGSTVDAQVSVSTPDEKEVRVTVAPGSQVARHVLRFSGNQSFDEDRLETVVTAAGLQVEGWLDPPRLTDAIEAFYREQGYLAVRATAGEATVEGDTGVLIVLLEEGPAYTVSAVHVTGVSEPRRASAEQVVRALTIGSAYDRAAVDRVAAELERQYRRQGFNDVRVDSRADVDARSPSVTLNFTVEEGAQQILRAISTEGVIRTREGVIRRALRLRVGQPVDLAQWSQSRKRMYDTNVFRQVDIEPVPMEPTPEDQAANIQPVRAVVRVVEYPAWRARYGLQYRDQRADDDEDATTGTRQDGFGILGDLQNQNLFGRGVTGGVAVSAQRERQATSLFASNGSFFTLPVRSNLFLFGVREHDQPTEFFETITERRGLSLEQRWRPFRSAEMTYGYRYERTRLFEPNPITVPGGPDPLDEVGRSGRIRSAFYIDRRNDPFNAHTGFFSSVNLDKAAQSLGSDFSSTKLLVQQFFYQTVGPVVLASAARVGTSYRFTNIQFLDRFFAGGATTVRGYSQDALGPLDLFNRPRGGASLLILNQEVRFPMFWRLAGVGFLDAGNVWGTRAELSLGDLELGYGFGLRVNTPFALLRVDYGIPVSSIPVGRGSGFLSGRWYFGIGQIF